MAEAAPPVAAPAAPAAPVVEPVAPVAAPAAPAAEAKPAPSSVASETPPAKEGEKPAEKTAGEKPVEIKPEDITIKVPEGLKVEEKTLTELKGILADAKMTPSERGEKLLAMHAATLKEAAEQPYKLWTETQAKWVETVKADPEIGGANFEPMKSSVAKMIDSVGGKEAAEIRKALDFTGAGNEPSIIRLLARAAKAINEGGPIAGKPADTAAAQEKALASMYPNAKAA